MKHSPNVEHEQFSFPIEYHFLAEPNSEHGGIIEGYGATFGHPLENGFIVDAGAFKKTIPERIKRQGGSMVPYFDSHEWNIAHTIGTVSDGAEDSKGFHFKAPLSKAPSAQDAYIKMKEGHIKLNSIGFNGVREAYVPETLDGKTVKRRHIQEVKLYEISAVPLAMDPQAAITRVHGLVPFQDLPLAARDTKWDFNAARDRVIAWAKSGEEINWSKLRKAYLQFDPDRPCEIGYYYWLFADIVEGELMAVPAAIVTIAASWDSPHFDAAVQGLERYYHKMAEEFHDESIVPPWKKLSIDALIVETKRIGVYDMGDIRKAADEFFSVLKPEDRKRLLAELSAGPATSPPTEGTRDSGALDDAKREAFASRLTQLGSNVSELTRRRGK